RYLEVRVGAELTACREQRTFHRPKNGEESEEDIARGKERGKRVGCAPGPAGRRARIKEAFLERELRHQLCLAGSLRCARILEPPETRSPDRTLISHSGPKKISTREPNLMSPTR